VEFDSQLYHVEQAWDYLPAANVEEEEWIMNTSKAQDTVYAPGLSFVHDNSLSGSTGPLVGWRGFYQIRKSFAKNELDYFTNYLDLRSYSYFNKRYSFATRLNAGISTGKSPDRFNLHGYYGVRALDEALSGEKKVLTSAELRFPFLDYIAIGFQSRWLWVMCVAACLPMPVAYGTTTRTLGALTRANCRILSWAMALGRA